MKKSILSLCMFLIIAAAAFATTPPVNRGNNVAGTYGVCETINPVIQLVLNNDGTFHLLDKTNPAKPVVIDGTWLMKNNVVRLSGYEAANRIHNKWRTNKNNPCLVSRRGLEWVRICR